MHASLGHMKMALMESHRGCKILSSLFDDIAAVHNIRKHLVTLSPYIFPVQISKYTEPDAKFFRGKRRKTHGVHITAEENSNITILF